MRVLVPDIGLIAQCARVYADAYGQPPWCERYAMEEVEAYLCAYLNSDAKRCFALMEEEAVVGVALGVIVPCIGAPFFRIEDFCIAPGRQRMGFGSVFLREIGRLAAEEACDSILLGTQRGFPSHGFYLKNGFAEIETALLYREI